MTVSVYWIHSKECTDIFTQGYVGITSNFEQRLYQHKNRTGNLHFKRAIKKYGWDNLVKEIVLVASKEYCLMIEKLLRNTSQIGWNVAEGGGNPPIQYNNQYRKGLPSPNKGKKATEEQRLRLSKLRIGKPVRLKGSKLTESHIEAIKKYMEASKWECPHCKKIGKNVGAGNRWHFDNCKMNKDK